MEFTNLGKTDIKISKICVGGMSFGDRNSGFQPWTLDAAGTRKILAHALELGINFFDTANCYSAGTSEEFLSQLWELTPRENVVLASKVYFNDGKLSRAAIEREIAGTLRRLRTDYLDLYIIHRFDYSTPIDETLEALDALVRAGKVRAIGASAMFAYQFFTMQIRARERGFSPFVVMQNHYNLLNREEEREMIPLCRQLGVALTPYSPLAAGRLCVRGNAETLRRATDKVAAGKYERTAVPDAQIVARVAEIAQKHACTMTQIALAWQFAKGVSSVLIGATKPEHFDDAEGTFSVNLSPEEVKFLEEPYVPHELFGVRRPGQ